MRLEKIKLAGFKSFVDATVVHLPSNLVGIVGPNGCGKSNVIDAVRWVMGESSAKMLRGESMADVIFNGSTARKPVGAAVIELMFDNSLGRAGGQYANYNQISVKRQISRDGDSSYFLNGTRCRRRDISDLFLGTGLGPRSYSIIEQGMISRLIEARPEDLRLFLEEAAGISKYKERRRETETRIQSTRENLSRLNDLRDEVGKQLQHLQRQAATAEKYKELKEAERVLSAELLALRWRDLDQRLAARRDSIGGLETAWEALVARQRHLEAVLEDERDRHHDLNDLFNQIQARYYAIGAEISRLEQGLGFARERARKQEQDLAQLQTDARRLDQDLAQDESGRIALLEELQSLLPTLEEDERQETSASAARREVDRALQDWQHHWDGFNQEAAVPTQVAQVERSRLNQLETQGDRHQRQIQRLEQELERLETKDLEVEILEMAAREEELVQLDDLAQGELDKILKAIEQSRGRLTSLLAELDRCRAGLRRDQARQDSLQTLQQAALGKDRRDLGRWLHTQGLAQAPRLAEVIEVEPGWRRAVEVVLGDRLQAVCTEHPEAHIPAMTGVTGSLTLVANRRNEDDPPPLGSDRLRARIRGPKCIDSLVNGVRLADSPETVLRDHPRLVPGESLVTREGIWIGPDWVHGRDGQDTGMGVLQRAEELRTLQMAVASGEEQVAQLELDLERERQLHRQQEEARDGGQKKLRQLGLELAEIRAQLAQRHTRREHILARQQAIAAEIHEVNEQAQMDVEAMQRARERLHQALERMEELARQRDVLVQQREAWREQGRGLGEQLEQIRSRRQRLALRAESIRASRQSLEQHLDRTRSQLAEIGRRGDELRLALAAGQEPIERLMEDLERQLGLRLKVEAELGATRTELEGLDTNLREHDRERHQLDGEAQQLRARLEAERLDRQDLKVRLKTLEEPLATAGVVVQEILQRLEAGASEAVWAEKLNKLELRIERLGPVNLAAIDEYQDQARRMEYLEAQFADINASLETLENAIRKIDRETRSRFREVFDQVNTSFQELFPRLFGGGHAYLELTGDDLLNTGVSVMARPPGKRNSSIHQLSGGEKALTAVALVFAIFHLNPAPFCMLDEVDAPLDDANVGRFCELVKSMSTQVQFIFITHNKVTMEMANQLTGVTMQEPGVSRLVAVDVEEAVKLAAI